MAIETFRLGPAAVYVPQRVATLVPSLSGVTVTAAATTPDDLLNNSSSADLDTTATYQVAVALLGQDTNVGGLTLTPGTGASGGAITVTAGQGIIVSIAATALPANSSVAYAMAVFLKKNSGTYKLVDYAYVDTDNGFNYMVMTEPDTQTGYLIADLTATSLSSTYPELGNRVAKGAVFTKYRTSGGVTVTRETQDVPVKPDDGGDYTLPTTRTSALSFSVLQNDMKQVVLANAGKYGVVKVGGHTISLANMSFQSAVAQVTGNLPFKLVLPPDASKVREIRLYLASISTNTRGASEHWAKDATTLLTFTVNPVNLDPLLNDVSTEICYKFKS